MPGGRKTLPLFELIGDRKPERPEPLRTLIPPQTVPGKGTAPNYASLEAKPLPELAAEIRGEHAPEEPARPRQPIVLTRSMLLVGIGVIAAVAILVWSLGVAFGGRQKEQDFQKNFPDLPKPTETLTQAPKTQPPVAKTPVTPSPIDAAATPPGKAQQPVGPVKFDPKSTTLTGSGRVLALSGFVEADPRQAGWNYLVLGLLPREDTWAAMQFMNQNGVETFAVQVDPVDRRLPRGNTSARFQLYAAKGVPSRDFASTQVERDKLKKEVARLGAIWKKDHKGSASFSDAFWLKN
ncbi:MAG: hypothetical protein ACK58T_29785 [Phycisphaerae bacterium]|jgi:hypothetical protein